MSKQLAIIFLLLLLNPLTSFAQEVQVTDASINAGQNVVWTADNTYILNGIVFVEDGATLTIEAGTVVKGQTGQGNQASALVVAQGGRINAYGTAENPIIFTSIFDDVNDPDDLTYADRGLWGGVVLLGRASTNNPTEGGIKQVEGIDEIVGEGDTRAQYGGTDEDDNSGVLRYVSIRHTGIQVGDRAGNEIQGLTLGAVGRGTTIEYVESYASADDGFEWFGGTVNAKYLVSAFNADDAFDYDEGFRGKGQFWFALLGTDQAGAAAEQDGATNDEFYEPFAIPVIYNATYLGPGVGNTPQGDQAQLLIFRDNAGGKYFNSIFTDFQSAEGGLAIRVEDIDNTGAQTADSRQRLEVGDLELQNNIWWGFGAGNEINQFANQDFMQTYLSDTTNANQVVDPLLRSISREANATLDPRPELDSPAFSVSRADYPEGDTFFTPVDFTGAFGETNWLTGWTALDQVGFVGTEIEKIDSNELPTSITLQQNYPNPFNPTTSIEFTLDQAQPVRLAVYDVLGRSVATLVDGIQTAGSYRVQFDATNLASGVYMYQLKTDQGVITRTMSLVK